MSAGPHLLQRARRWWHLKLLQTRIDQLAALVAQMEAEIAQTHNDLAAVRMSLARNRLRMLAATQPRPSHARGQPFTWGL